ncbi:hypothetical protein ABT234_11975 [Streptomyces sp. NPDC001586]
MNREEEQPLAGRTGRQSIGQAVVDWLVPLGLSVEIIERVMGIWQNWM